MILNPFGKSWSIVKSFFTAVRENEGAHLPIGAAGFCWGGKHTVHLAHGHQTADGKPLIDAGFTGHPSNLVIPDEVAKIKKPISIAVGHKDMALKPSQIEEIKKVVEEKPDEEKGEVKIYYGANHGFCVRADLMSKDSEQQATEAEDQCISWFNQHFRDLSY
jgi:dienelactone hydrolase